MLKLIQTSWIGVIISTLLPLPFFLFLPSGEKSVLVFLGLALVTWLAFENGGNDVSRGIAPLVASKNISIRTGLLFGTVMTVLGSVFSIYFSVKLFKLFTKGILNTDFDVTQIMVLAIIFGASLWVAVATKFSLPVSTTHSLVGSMILVGILSFGIQGVLWTNLLALVVIPLLLSPVVGFVVAWVLAVIINRFTFFKPLEKHSIWLFSGAVCFVRAVNDTPKIVGMAVLIGFAALNGLTLSQAVPFFILITLAMALGSYIKGSKVTHTLAYKVTDMKPATGLAAAVTSASLILFASKMGLPVSTTHVSTSSIIGSGFASGSNGSKGLKTVNWSVVKDIVLSWVLTLPGAGILGAIGYFILSAVF
ncbi:inorganic phosphate transporter [Paenibacillus prosopidis]|uniref:Phosphate transporter n=1 Tax=Paenibacillus prosopidis TaxID=630520 RepID=A0A368VYH7_9BACL|nr:inorganic phosphate transporter [Paenibacillus prosopidis]RCW46467.1 phosphate/sulfate permease [Paenibacillus prosopidis]